jgi:hypothetical protein
MEVVSKGQYDDGYSAFDGTLSDGTTKLEDALKQAKIKRLNICGVALDYCVMASALSAREILGKDKVEVLEHLTASVNPSDLEKVRDKMRRHEIIVNSRDYYVMNSIGVSEVVPNVPAPADDKAKSIAEPAQIQPQTPLSAPVNNSISALAAPPQPQSIPPTSL